MEAAAGRSGSHAVPSSHPSTRKEWRAISEHSFQKIGADESENVKLGQTDERTIYEINAYCGKVQEGIVPVNINFCSISMNGEDLKEDVLQHRIQEISRKREELQQMEIELKAQAIVRPEISVMHNRYQTQLKVQIDAVANLKDQLKAKDQKVHEMDLDLEEKNRELHSVKIDNEAVWAKEDLFREQNKELANFRRERDNSEAERAQLLKKNHDLQEHIQDKENQYLALEEQHRVAQETILYKDEQLRELQAWMTRVQEVDALQSTTNRSLQAELRERTEQFNQYWLLLQQQFAEMERHHLQTIQQLHFELAEVKGRSEAFKENSQLVLENEVDPSLYHQNNGNQVNASDGAALNNGLSFGPDGKKLTSYPVKTEHAPLIPPVFGMNTFAPVGHMTALHPFSMPQQDAPESIASANHVIPQSHAADVQPVTAMAAHNWQNQQAIQEFSQAPNQGDYHPMQLEQNLFRSHSHYRHESSNTGNELNPEYLSPRINHVQGSAPETFVSNEQMKVFEAENEAQEVQAMPNAIPYLIAPLFESTDQKSEQKVPGQNAELANNEPHQQVLSTNKPQSAINIAETTASSHCVSVSSFEERSEDKPAFTAASAPSVGSLSSMPTRSVKEPPLLDERALLACIVRAIPAGSDGRIKISTTLPNRLGKMLAPLHWHDYKKYYGKLDEFVACHPELFVIEEDYIHLCDGAQEIISATAALAKVAAAAASFVPYPSMFPSVAVTPIAQSNRKKSVLIDSKPVNSALFPQAHAQQQNGVSHNSAQEFEDIAPSSRKTSIEKSGLAYNPSLITGNGSNKALANGKIASGGKKQGRASVVGGISRK